MLKVYFAFVKKEFYHILRDRRTLLILFGIPVALVLIFGYTVTNEFKGASISILDQAHDELSQELGVHLQASGHFELVEASANYGDIEAAFQAGKVKMAIVIPPGFSQSFYGPAPTHLQFIADASDPNYGSTLITTRPKWSSNFRPKNSKETLIPFKSR